MDAGDPHPGNIFVLGGGLGPVALLDCGQVKQCSSQQRLALARLVLLIHDWEGMQLKQDKLREDDEEFRRAVGRAQGSDESKVLKLMMMIMMMMIT